MSFGLSTLRAKHANPVQVNCENFSNSYGLSDALSNGVQEPVRTTIENVHPLQHAVRDRRATEDKLNMNILRNVQGIHAPLRLAMELESFKNVGRLPFLTSSRLLEDVLTGRDDVIDFEDVLNPPEVHERLNKPCIVMEKRLGIL